MKTFNYISVLITFIFIANNPTFAQWVLTGPYGDADVHSFAVGLTTLFVGTEGSGVYRSTNNGTSWTQVNSGLTNTNVYALTYSIGNLFAGTGNGVFLSTSNGTSWTAVNSGLTNTNVYALAVLTDGGGSTYIFAGTDGEGVYRSTNNGTSWTAVNSGLTNTYVHSLVISGITLFAGTAVGIFRSTNIGISWTAINSGLTNTYIQSLTFYGLNLFAGTFGGVFRSTNNGTSWTAVNSGLTNTNVYALAAFSSSNLFAGTWGGGIFRSSNNGTSWTDVNSGLTNTYIRSLIFNGLNLFAGTGNGGAWRRPLSEMITAVEILPNEVPVMFSLNQNYPNPFNPTTTISFGLPAQCFVSLKIFNSLGQEVSELASEELPAGMYLRQWNAERLTSGMYFYRLEARQTTDGQAGQFSATKKLVLLR